MTVGEDMDDDEAVKGNAVCDEERSEERRVGKECLE